MIIRVRVIPNSRTTLVQQVAPSEYVLKVRERAVDGRANSAAIDLLSSYFNVKKPQITIIKGAKGREKVIRIDAKLND